MVKQFYVHLVDVGTGSKTSVEVGGYQRASQIASKYALTGAYNVTIEVKFIKEESDNAQRTR